MEFAQLGKIIIFLGVALVFLGIFWTVGFRVPGDVSYQGKHWTFYFPFGTSLLLSVIITLTIWLWASYFK